MIVRTRKVRMVHKLLERDEQLWASIGGSDMDVTFPDTPDHYYLLCMDEEHGLLGVCIAHKLAKGIYEGHVNFFTKYWGTDAPTAEAAQECFAWVFKHTPAKEIVAEVPHKFPAVQSFTERVGMKPVRSDDKSCYYRITKDGADGLCRQNHG